MFNFYLLKIVSKDQNGKSQTDSDTVYALTTKTTLTNPFPHYRIAIKWCYVFEISPKKTHSHIETSNLLFRFIGEYLSLIISIIIIYWFRIQKEKENYMHAVGLNVNAQFTMELVRTLHTNSSIKNCDCVFIWLIFINWSRERKL